MGRLAKGRTKMPMEWNNVRRYPGLGTFIYQADFAVPSCPIFVQFPAEGDEWLPVPFVVADCYDRRDTERRIAEHFGG